VTELGARAFSGYLEDKLEAAKRKNTYLTANANNKHPDYVFMGVKPYPEGDERKRINKAFDALFQAMKKDKTLKKAAAFLDGEELRKALPGKGRFHAGLAVGLYLLRKSNPYHDEKGRFAARNAAKLKELYASALNRQDQDLKGHVIRGVTNVEADKIKAATGIDVRNYQFTVTNTGLRHIHRSHGDPSTETAAGQIAITEQDILRIPEIISRPDRIAKATDTRMGDKAIVFEKRYRDGTIRYVAEVLVRGRLLNAKTMMKNP
jgi:hypothetical protein